MNALGNVWLFVSGEEVTSIEVIIQSPPCGDDYAASTVPITISNDSFTASFSGVTPSCPAVTVTGTFSGTHVSGVFERRWIPSEDCPCNASGSNGFFSNFLDNVFFDGFEIGFGPG